MKFIRDAHETFIKVESDAKNEYWLMPSISKNHVDKIVIDWSNMTYKILDEDITGILSDVKHWSSAAEDKPLKDSGERAKFNTGAERDTNTNKGRFDLLPAYTITRLAKHYEKGAKKYDARNWEKGIPLSRYIDSALRHLFNHQDGQRDEDHMAAALWNITCFIETEERIRRGVLPATLDDTQPVTNLHKIPETPS